MTVRSCVLPLCVLAFCASVEAQTPTAPASAAAGQAVPRYRFRLLGVYDDATGEPVEGVQISDLLSGASSLTSKTGTVSLFFLPDGGSMVRIRKVGYEMQTFAVAISPADTTPLTIVLRRAVELPKVTVVDSAPIYVSPMLRGAEDRLRSHAGGYFVSESEMRAHDNSTLANVLVSKLPGLQSVPGAHGETYVVSTRQQCANALRGCSRLPNCYVRVFLDGTPISTPRQTDFSRLYPTDYAIAEFYPGGASVPAEYAGTNTSCGVLLLWSRER